MPEIRKILYFFLLTVLQLNLTSGGRCIANNKIGNCVALNQCPQVMADIVRAGGLQTVYARNRLRALNCGMNGLMICCLPPSYINILNIKSPSTPKPNKPIPTDVNEIPGYNKVGSKDLPDVQRHPNLKLLPTACGTIYSNDRIVGGNQANMFEMPWMALLLYDIGTEIAPKCGGTLINEWYVLTAAHCVTSLPSSYELVRVVLGEYDMRQDPDCQTLDEEEVCAPKVEVVEIAEAIPHPGYNRKTLFDDIALIRLKRPANFSLDYTKPVCLPFTPQLQKESLVGVNADVAGWGLTEGGVPSPVLLSVSIPVVSTEDCKVRFKGQALIHERQLCAGGVKGKDSCNGDSGGPLTFPGRVGRGSARHVQRGVVSFGTKNCGSDGIPGIYTNVAHYMDWILDHMHA